MLADVYDSNDGLGLAALVAHGDLKATEVVEFAIRRIEARNPRINAVVASRFEQALEEAGRGLPQGPFRGVPFLIKDFNCPVDGMPLTNGSRLCADVVASVDSELVARYRRAGLVILGMSNSPEFAKNASTESVLHGPTSNPHDESRSAGGSSGGAAAAVASGMVPVANGSDGGGSIRIPASACGLVGLKPSRGLVPFAPALVELCYTIGTQHALTRTVRDSAALLDVARGAIAGAAFAAPRGPADGYLEAAAETPRRLRIALFTETVSGLRAHPDCVSATENTARLCEELGHEVVEARPAYSAEEAGNAFNTLAAANVSHAIDQRLAELNRELQEDDVEPLIRMMWAGAKGMSALDMVRALQSVERIGHRIGEFFESHDVALSPTMAVPTPALGLLDTSNLEAMFEHGPTMSSFTKDYNLAGVPAISLPLGRDSSGMPVGVQFAARHGEDALLLGLASEIERAAPWSTAPVERTG